MYERESFNAKMPTACFLLFFAHGLVTSSWASRIPIIKEALSINEAQLGTLLLLMPIGQLSTMMLSGKLISRYRAAGSLKLFLIVSWFSFTDWFISFLLDTGSCSVFVWSNLKSV
jgi:hypothetical protein